MNLWRRLKLYRLKRLRRERDHLTKGILQASFQVDEEQGSGRVFWMDQEMMLGQQKEDLGQKLRRLT